jgi:hypothetical protein
LVAGRLTIIRLANLQSPQNKRLCLPVGLSLVCSENVQVCAVTLVVPVGVPVRERLKLGEGVGVDLAAIFADAPEQRLSRSAEGATPPAGVLLAGIALPPLQNPLQRIIHDPPVRIELGYKAI